MSSIASVIEENSVNIIFSPIASFAICSDVMEMPSSFGRCKVTVLFNTEALRSSKLLSRHV
jgi:hypothetical protein